MCVCVCHCVRAHAGQCLSFPPDVVEETFTLKTVLDPPVPVGIMFSLPVCRTQWCLILHVAHFAFQEAFMCPLSVEECFTLQYTKLREVSSDLSDSSICTLRFKLHVIVFRLKREASTGFVGCTGARAQLFKFLLWLL